MIKIKNHIYNENEIISINESTENDSISIKFKTDSYFILENATFEDIEWNYGEEIKHPFINSDSLRQTIRDKNKIKELEEKNKRLKEKYDYIVKENRSWYEKWKKLLNRINEAVEYIEQWRDVKTKRIDNRLKRTLEILIGKRK